jgi:general L-amino acid transport system permease protein
MAKKTTSSAIAYVRTEPAPLLPPPASQTGIFGWLHKNILASMTDFSSPMAAVKSLLMAFFTVLIGYVGVFQIISLVDFAFISAVWSDPEGLKREACWTVDQGGSLPSGWHGACWPFVKAKFKFLMYGPYDMDQLWRVNVTGIIGLVALAWLLIEPLPLRRYVGIFLLTVYPVLSIILLYGTLDPSSTTLSIITLGGILRPTPTALMGIVVVGLGLMTLARLGSRGVLSRTIEDHARQIEMSGWVVIAYALIFALFTDGYNLDRIDTNDWGGLMITLVVAITGIVASLPLGILLALGRRSTMPAARIISTVFIEFWRGVPLITVLFMASVMLPLFLPEGVNFDNLLRALVGVMLFSAAYMAEVVRGGLQAIDKGQFEGSSAVGLTYWQSMRLVILPQALTHVIPGIVNTFIGLFKDTTLVSIIGLFDLLGAGQSALADAAWASPVQSHSMYLFIAAIFFVFCFGMSRYSIYMENKLSRSRRH